MEPRVDSKGAATETVAPARPAGKEGPHLPWTGSMAGPEFPLTYMPFMEHMLNVLARSFGEMTALPLADKLAFVENKDKKARMLRLVPRLGTTLYFERAPLCSAGGHVGYVRRCIAWRRCCFFAKGSWFHADRVGCNRHGTSSATQQIARRS